MLMTPGTTFTGLSTRTYTATEGNQLVEPADVRLALINGWTEIFPQGPAAANAVPSVSPVRAICIGDSHQCMGFSNNNLPSSAGTFVVSGGIATIIHVGNFNTDAGNYITLSNQGDTTFGAALNGACVPVLTSTANSTITTSATYNGKTMPDGDYSTINGTPWVAYLLTHGTDSGLQLYLNYRAGNPLVWVANYGMIGGTAAYQVALLDKIKAGPKFEVAFIEAGTNEVGGGGSLGLQPTLAGIQDAYRNIVTLCNAMIAYGARVVLWTGVPMPSGISAAQTKNLALALLRQQLVQFAQVTQGITVLDTWKDSILGTATNGDLLSNYAHSSSDVHFSSYGNYALAGVESNVLTTFARPFELGPVSVLEDFNTYSQLITAWAASTGYTVGNYVSNAGNIYRCIQPGTSAGFGGPTGSTGTIIDGTCVWAYQYLDARNLVIHGMMDGTGGSLGATFTGTVPTNWTLSAGVNLTGAGSSTSTSAQTRTAVSGTNAVSWGYGWNLTAVFSAAGSFYALSNDWGSQWRSAIASFGGGWFRAGVTIGAITSNPTILKAINLQVTAATANSYFEATCGWGGNNTTTLPLLTTDAPMEMITQPFYIKPGIASTQSTMFITILSSAAGTVNLQLSNAWCRRVPSPYSY